MTAVSIPFRTVVVLALAIITTVHGFSIPTQSVQATTRATTTTTTTLMMEKNADDTTLLDRKSFLSTMTAAAAVFGFSAAQPALASGGATAGGAYLLSAKQRYNARVTAGVKSFVGLKESLLSSSPSIDATANFLSVKNTDEGSWGDMSAAGYLLANAFRRSSTTPPDNLPSVKVCECV